MRVGLVTGEYPPMEGGVGAFTEQLARALSALNWEPHIITSRRARPDDASRSVSTLREPVNLGYARLHPRINRWRWPSISTIVDLIIRYDLDIVNLQYQPAAFNMNSPAINFLPWRLRGIAPAVVTFHDLRVPYLFPKANGLRGWVVRTMARRSAGCIATNAADLTRLQQWTDKPLRHIPIGSNIDAYDPNHVEIAEARDHLHLGRNDILLGYFGFLNESKGADVLIDALSQLDDHVHLVFFGGRTGASDAKSNQGYLDHLQQVIDRRGLHRRVHWTGFLPPMRVSTYLSAADLMVMPYRDGVSSRRGTLMAVLAHGRPLVTTSPGKLEDGFEHDKNMWLVPPDDARALADAVRSLGSDPARRTRLGQGAKELAKSFGWDAIARQTAEFYEELVSIHERPAA